MDLVKKPYRTLIQHGPNGEVQGVSYQEADVLVGADGQAALKADGKPIHWQASDPVPASDVASGKGWPISDVVAKSIADGLIAAAPKLADYDAKVAQLERVSADHEALKAAVAEAK